VNRLPLKTHLKYILSVLLLASSCAPESNTWLSKGFHNTTAHYNGYYYALDEIRKIETTIQNSNKDDYNRVLRLFPGLDSVLAKGYDDQIQEAVKMASLAIQRHPNSKWVDDSYLLVGKARLYSLDWGNAIQTFKFVNTKGADASTKHQALILLARTFTEHGEYANAEAAFSYLEKEKLSKTNRKNLYLEKAYYYQVIEDDDKFVRNLTAAAPLLSKKDRPGRIYFILGQVYQKLGFESEAYNYFRECLQTHPEYEVDFYARLYMAQVAEISKSRNIANARKSFKKLLKDSKNKDFKDKIYYEMGVFERKQDNIAEAITNYQLAIKEGTRKQIDGEAYLRLGEIYYDTLRKFEVAKLYYDSAVAALSKDYENYDVIKSRQEVLEEFVHNLKTIAWQDSLLVMAKMDSATLMEHITALVESKKPPQTKESKKKKRSRIDIGQVNTGMQSTTGFVSSDWYFGNASAIALGQQEFKRIWGTIPLEDNWRRSSRATPMGQRPTLIAGTDTSSIPDAQPEEEIKTDPVLDEYTRITKELPKTEEQVATALEKIEDAYFNLGDIYYFKLLEKNNAVITYDKLLVRFPDTPYRPEVLYKLYIMFKETQPERANRYAQELINQFPETSYAKILINPDYLLESSIVMEKQKVLYKDAYEKYEANEFTTSLAIVESAMAMEKTPFSPYLELLRILNVGKTEPIARYQYLLDEFIKNYPETELSAHASKLLMTSRDFEMRKEKERGIRYVSSADAPHYFILVFKTEAKIEDITSKSLTFFNQQQTKDPALKVSNLLFNDTYTLTMVTELNGKSEALEYYRSFTEKQASLTELKNHKFNTFVISKDNFDIFYRTKGLDEYLQFFEKNYRSENP
jgi:tetratricopeptide (TPR) repeat protein